MRLICLTLAIACLVTSSAAQEPGPRVPAPGIMPVIPHDYDSIRQYLALSESQVNTLKQLQESLRRSEQAIYEQMGQRQQQLSLLLEQGSNDAATIGRLSVEINNLRRQVPGLRGQSRPQAVAVLNDTQKAKLAELQEALRAQRPAGEAVSLNLMDYPNVPDVRILPWPAVEVSAHAANVP